MSKSKNYYFYSTDMAVIDRLVEEYIFIGRDCKKIKEGLVVYALPKRHKKSPPEKPAKRERKSR